VNLDLIQRIISRLRSYAVIGAYALAARGYQSDTLIDLVVAKYKWQDALIDRAEPLPVESTTLRIPRPADLILLKLFAGGPGDLHDIARLLDIGPRQPLIKEVSDALAGLPDEMRARWELMVRESRQP
jgi:hypothetical protein